MERRIDKDYKCSHSEIPWRDINGLRNIVVHNYDAIDYLAIWETLTTDIPSLEDMYINLLQTDFEYDLNTIDRKIQDEIDKAYKKRMSLDDDLKKDETDLEL